MAGDAFGNPFTDPFLRPWLEWKPLYGNIPTYAAFEYNDSREAQTVFSCDYGEVYAAVVGSTTKVHCEELNGSENRAFISEPYFLVLVPVQKWWRLETDFQERGRQATGDLQQVNYSQ